MARSVAGDLAEPRGRLRPLGFRGMGEPTIGPGRGASGQPGDTPDPGASRRPHGVLLPVPASSWPFLRRAPVPIGRSGALCHRNRGPAPAALDHPALGRSGTALKDSGVSATTTDAVVEENATARLDALRSSLAILAFIALIALFFTRKIPNEQPASSAGRATGGT